MKKLLFGFALVGGLVALSSCNKNECYDCMAAGATTTEELCEDDYGSDLLFDTARSVYTLGGGTCTKQ